MRLCRPLVALVAWSVSVGALSCTGQIADPGSAGPAAPGASPTAGPSPSTPQTPQTPEDKSFALPMDAVTLLPFAVRLQKVAAVVGVPAADPLLQPLRDAGGQLGDYDFANSRKPDYTWTALRISDWVRALKPICGSSQMRARFSALPDALPQLIDAAYGRAITSDDRAAVDAGLMGLTLAEPARYEAVCLSVMSSLEFLAQ